MARTCVSAAIVMALAMAGCTRSNGPDVLLSDAADPGHAAVMVLERLEREDLPALLSAEPWNSEFGPGLKLTTDHYEIYSTVQQPLILRME